MVVSRTLSLGPNQPTPCSRQARTSKTNSRSFKSAHAVSSASFDSRLVRRVNLPPLLRRLWLLWLLLRAGPLLSLLLLFFGLRQSPRLDAVVVAVHQKACRCA